MYALTQIKGVGRRYANILCKKADVDLNKRYIATPFSSFPGVLTDFCPAPVTSTPMNSNAS
jgi:hypothetical protein